MTSPSALKEHDQTVPNQKGKLIPNPTMRWVFQLFMGIHLLLIQAVQALVFNLNDLHRQVLELLGPPYEALYS